MHGGHRQRLRDRFVGEGVDNFAPHEALELLLTFVIPRKDVNIIAHDLLREFGSFSAVLEADREDLCRVSGIAENASVFLSLIPQITRYYLVDKWGDKPRINNTRAASEYLRGLYAGRNYECFYLLCLDSQLHLLYPALIVEGTIDETPMYPRMAVMAALRHKAHSAVIAHNHPGGSHRASYGDIHCTKRLVNALASVEIDVRDHLIVCGSEVLSLFREEGVSARETPLDLGLKGWPECEEKGEYLL